MTATGNRQRTQLVVTRVTLLTGLVAVVIGLVAGVDVIVVAGMLFVGRGAAQYAAFRWRRDAAVRRQDPPVGSHR